MKKRILGIMALSFCIAACISTGAIFASAEGTEGIVVKGAEEITFTMAKGASVRLKSSSASGNGIRFEAQMSETDYLGLENNPAYSDVQYGMLIAPREYLTTGHELNFENVFGENSIYDWAPMLDDGTFGPYTGTKVRITNIVYDELEKADSDQNIRSVRGSLTNILQRNLTYEFVGLGYIAYTPVDGETQYKFADYYDNDIENNTRSISYVAQLAYEDTGSGAPSASQKEILYRDYIQTAESVSSYYYVEHYKQTEDGYVLDGEAEEHLSTVNSAVTAEEKELGGYYLVNNENTVASGYVYANDHLTLKLYYDKKTIEIADAATIYPFGATVFLPSATVIGGGETMVKVEAPDGTEVTVTDNAFTATTAGGGVLCKVYSDGKQ